METHSLTNPLQRDPAGSHEIHDLQRALDAAKIYFGPIDGIFGAGTADACKRAKWRFGYPRRAVVATGGQTLYNYLTGKRQLPPLYKLRRRARGYGLTRDEKTRTRIVA